MLDHSQDMHSTSWLPHLFQPEFCLSELFLAFITPTSTCSHIILFKQLRMSRTSCRVHSASCSCTQYRMFISWDFAHIKKLNGSQYSHLQMEPTSQELVTEYPVSSIPGRPKQIEHQKGPWKNSIRLQELLCPQVLQHTNHLFHN